MNTNERIHFDSGRIDQYAACGYDLDRNGPEGWTTDRAKVTCAECAGMVVDAQLAEMTDDEANEEFDGLPLSMLVDPCPVGDPACETGDDGSCHDGCTAPDDVDGDEDDPGFLKPAPGCGHPMPQGADCCISTRAAGDPDTRLRAADKSPAVTA